MIDKNKFGISNLRGKLPGIRYRSAGLLVFGVIVARAKTTYQNIAISYQDKTGEEIVHIIL
jgi:hypothetical protein